MSEADSVRLSLVQRTSFETPAALNMDVLATTGQTLRNNVGYQESQTLRTDANVQDLVRLSLGASGGVPIEMQFPIVNEALWFALRAVLRSTETAQASTAACTTAAGTKTITKAAEDFAASGHEVGDIIKLSGGLAADMGFVKITAVAVGTLTVERATNFTGSVGNVTVVRGARMKNGTERYFFDAEVGRLDVNLFELYRKLVFNGMSLTISDQAITAASFDMLGVSTERGTSPLCLDYDDPTPGPILDALGVPVFNFGGLAYSTKSIGFSISNNIRTRTQVGTLGGAAFPFGKFSVATRSSSYLANWTEMGNYTGNVASNMWFVMQNVDNQALSFSFPRHKWADLAADTRGTNQDDYLDGTGRAIVDPVELCTMRVQRWVA